MAQPPDTGLSHGWDFEPKPAEKQLPCLSSKNGGAFATTLASASPGLPPT